MSEAVPAPDETAPALEHAAPPDWPLRPWLLAVIGALAGLFVWWLIDEGSDEPWRLGLASFAFFAAVAAGFTLRPRGWLEPVLFALGLGLVMGAIAWMAARANDSRAGEEFAFAAGVFFSILAVPLFQADFHRKRFATPYRETHFHVWTDAVSAGGAFAFTMLSYALLWVLNGLFRLIGVDVILDLIQDGWFLGLFFGGTFGAALGVIRNNLKVLGALQGVVLIVFSLLAVPFAAAILVFLVLLLSSGGQALWEATDDATPVLLTCAVGCFVLANSVIRDHDDARSANRVMQVAAAVLAAAILPLGVFAAISMGIRIDQYGLAPERIWALVAIVVAVTYGIAYWAGLARGRLAGWSAYLRQANLHLAAATCLLALFLALPILDFGGISARNQVARLEEGKVSPEEFDFAALRWDFGDAGRRALDRLAEGEGEAAELAAAMQATDKRPPRSFNVEGRPKIDPASVKFTGISDEIRRDILEYLQTQDSFFCDDYCRVLALGADDDGNERFAVAGQRMTFTLGYEGGRLKRDETLDLYVSRARLTPDSKVEIREITRRYLFVDGVPMAQPLDPLPSANPNVDVDRDKKTENLLITVTTTDPEAAE